MEAEKMNSTNPASQEPNKIAYILHFFLGAGNLLPWNALISAIDYFGYLYPNKHVEKVFSVAYMASSLCILGVLLSWDWCRKRLSFRLRMNLGFSLFVLSLMVTPIMHWICHKKELKMKSSMGYDMVVSTVVICGLADGLIAGSLIGTAGKLPRQYMQAIFAGTASSGVLITILRIITKASLPQTPQGLKLSANLYFIASTIILIGCIICCNWLCNLPFMQQHYKLSEQESLQLFSSPKFCEIVRKIRGPAFGIFMIYAVTLSIFPGFLAENIESNFFKDWYPVMLIAIYNIFDFVGKSLTGIYVMESIGKATWGCMGRILFYPMFSGVFRGPEWLRTEAVVVVLTIMLGLTNGYLTSVVMILAPKAVPPAEAEIAAMVMVLILGMGLVTGSLVGWFWII